MMSVQTEERTSRRKILILSGITATLAIVTCGIYAKRAGWTKWIGSRLARLGRNPTVELKFCGPFESDKSLLDEFPKNGWVSVERAVCRVRDYRPECQDQLELDFGFSGEKTRGRDKELVDPYKIACMVFVRDKQGKEHIVRDEIVEYDSRIFTFQLGGGLVREGGAGGYSNVYALPVKLKDTSDIRVCLRKIPPPF